MNLNPRSKVKIKSLLRLSGSHEKDIEIKDLIEKEYEISFTIVYMNREFPIRIHLQTPFSKKEAEHDLFHFLQNAKVEYPPELLAFTKTNPRKPLLHIAQYLLQKKYIKGYEDV